MYTHAVRLEPFVPQIIRRVDREKPWVEWIPGTVLFADVSGFTPLSEALAALGAEGAEILTDILNRYFSEMIGILHAHGGQVMKFGGDAILCFLEGEARIDAALHASCRMQSAMKRFQKVKTPVKTVSLQMKIGVASGDCMVGGIGDPATRCDYLFAGAPVDLSAEAEHHAAAGEVIAAQSADGWEQQEVAPGFFRITPPQEPAAFVFDHVPEIRSDPGSLQPYLIPEIYKLVSQGYQRHAGSLSAAVSVFLRFEGFEYSRSSLDLPALNDFLKAVLAITQQHGGRLNRISMGDKGSTMLLLFGTPAPLEKKEQIACQWAVELREQVTADFPRVRMQIGMTSGRVFSGIVGGSGRFEFTVMGDRVNLAARLMQDCATGEICVDASLQEKAADAFAFEPAGKRKFKGKSESIEVFKLKERSLHTKPQTHEVFGRAAETAVILNLLEEVRSGKPRMIVLEAEAGVGKSALASQVLSTAGANWKLMTARGDITRKGFAYNPWRDALVSILFENGEPQLEQLSAALKDAGFAEFLPWHAAYFGLHSDADSLRTYDEETKRNLLHHQLSVLLLQRVDSPVLLFLEDVHWFKSEHLDLLTAILNHAKDQTLAILATARPDWPRDSFVNRSTCHVLSLQPLDRSAIQEMAAKTLGAPVRENVVEFLENHARGNPFFLQQLLQYLKVNQLVNLRLGEWALSREGSLDRSLSGEDIVVTQIEQLSLPERLHLRAASCIGPTLSPAVLEKALGSKFRPRVLASLRARGYLQPSADNRLAFPHALFQEAIYHSLPKRLRRQYHRRIGFALEAIHSNEIAKYHPTLAHHFYEAGVRTKAVDYCIVAGNEYHSRKSAPEALQLLERAYLLLRNSADPRKWDVALRVADNMTRTGRAPECLSLTRKLISAARKTGNLALFFKSCAIQFDTMSRAADFSYLNRAVQLLKHPALEQNISPHRIRFYVGLAQYRMAHFDQASKEFRLIITTKKDATPTVLNSYMFLASIERIHQAYEPALKLVEQAIAHARKQNDSYRQLSISVEKANVLLESGKRKESGELLAQILQEANNLGDYYLIGVSLLMLGNLMMDEEKYDRAETYLDESQEVFSRLGTGSMLGKAIMDRGALHFYRSKFESALEEYQEALRIFESTKQMDQGCFAYYNIAEVLSKLNRKEEALQWLRKGQKSFVPRDLPALAKLYDSLYSALTAESSQ